MTYESYINYANYAIYDGIGRRVFKRQKIMNIDRIEFMLPDFPWVRIIFQKPADAKFAVINSLIVGEDGTYVKYKGNKYETMEDYYKLQQVIEKEKIKNILDDMDKG